MVTDYLSLSEYNKLYPYLSYDNYLALRVSLETGLRIGDVVALPADCLMGNEIRYTAQKTGKQGHARISNDLADRLRKISGKQYIFSSRGKSGHRTRQAVWRDVKQAAKLAGVSGNIAPHSARKTHAVQTFRQRGFAAAQRELQHSDPSTTLLYVLSDTISSAGRVSDELVRSDEIDRLADLIADRVVERLQGESCQGRR